MAGRAAASARPAGTTRQPPARSSASRTAGTARERLPRRRHPVRPTAANARRDAPTAIAWLTVAVAVFVDRSSQRAGGSTPPTKSNSLRISDEQVADTRVCSLCSAAQQPPQATAVSQAAAWHCHCQPEGHLCGMRRRACLHTRGCCAVHVLRTIGCAGGAARNAATCPSSHRTSDCLDWACSPSAPPSSPRSVRQRGACEAGSPDSSSWCSSTSKSCSAWRKCLACSRRSLIFSSRRSPKRH